MGVKHIWLWLQKRLANSEVGNVGGRVLIKIRDIRK